MNNCIGFRNHKFFLLFLLYATVGLFESIILTSLRLFHSLSTRRSREDYDYETNPLKAGDSLLAAVNLLIAIPTALGVFSLCYWQFYLALRNETTIEYVDHESYSHVYEKRGKAWLSLYDLGSRRQNVESLFGRNLWLAFLPILNMPGDGLAFVTCKDIQSFMYEQDMREFNRDRGGN